jgi:hypothetical protein
VAIKGHVHYPVIFVVAVAVCAFVAKAVLR